MTQTEGTQLIAAITQLSNQFVASSPIQFNMLIWKTDVQGCVDGTSQLQGQLITGSSEESIPVCTVAELPSTPNTNDEAVVTDSTVATNGGTVVGGGSTRVMVRWSGSAWQIV